MQKYLFSPKVRLFFLIFGFISLILLRQIISAFGVSLGYLYVTLISLAGFWFGIIGGLIAALVSSIIFLVETSLFKNWAARDIVFQGLFLRVLVYFIAGIVLGYLSWLADKRKKEIIELSKSKNKFIGIAAHDLRNPISVIRDCSVLLSDGAEILSEQKKQKFIDIIKRSSTFMLVLINDLLDISQIESGKLSLELKACDYVKFINEVVDFNRFLADKKKVTIKVVSEGDLPVVELDRAKMTQLVNNLIGNAIKYTYPETTITVNIKMEDTSIVTNIIDQGPGLSPEDKDNIFCEFYKGKVMPVGKEEHKSTGLGLAIAKKIIEGHDGSIGVTSELGQGAVFYFLIPIGKRGNKNE